MTGLFDDLPNEGEQTGGSDHPLFADLPTDASNTPAADAPPQTWKQYAEGVAQSAGEGVTSHWGDELAAGIGAGTNWAARKLGIPNTPERGYHQILDEIRNRGKAFEKANPNTAFAAELAGSLAPGSVGTRFIMGAPGLLSRAARAGLVSGTQSAVNAAGEVENPKDANDYITPMLNSAALGAGLGGGFSVAGSTLGNLVGPWGTAAARTLHNENIRLTPGDIMGGYAKRAEDSATAFPFINSMIRNRQAEGVTDFNRAYHARTLQLLDEGIGPQLRTGLTGLPADMATGREANQFVQQTMRNEYQRIVPQLQARVDTPFRLAVDGIEAGLPQSIRNDFRDAVQRHLYDNAANGPGGSMAGRDVQDALQGLRDEARRLITQGGRNAYSYDLGTAMLQVRDMLNQNIIQRSRPQVAQKFQNINAAYKSFAQTRRASGSVAADFGEFTPAMAHSAVKATDRTAEKGAFSAGTAMNQDLTDAAKSAMTRKTADSGTPERTALIALATGAAANMHPGVLGGFGGLAALYSPAGRAIFQHLAMSSPQTRQAARNLLMYGTSAAAPGAASELAQ